MALVACTGCTTMSLTEYTVNQNRTAGECRDQAVLNGLVAVAANPDTLPSYAVYSNGATTLVDTISPGYTATWAPHALTVALLQITGSRSPKGLWTVDPSAEYERIEAFHAACLWALFSPERATAKYSEILGDSQEFLNQNPHFGVASRLSKLAPGWINMGQHKDVPSCALLKAHCGTTWIWVMPENAEAFAQFVLVFQDIATLDINIVYSPPLIIQLTTNDVTKLPDASDKTKAVTITSTESRAVKREYRDFINNAIQESINSGKPVALTRAQWLEYTDPWAGLRTVPVLTPGASMPGRSPTGVQLSTVGSSTGTTNFRAVPDVKYQLRNE
jgi:hypothetical protein